VRASIDTFCGGNRDETPVKHGKRRDRFPTEKNRRINIMESDGGLSGVARFGVNRLFHPRPESPSTI